VDQAQPVARPARRTPGRRFAGKPQAAQGAVQSEGTDQEIHGQRLSLAPSSSKSAAPLAETTRMAILSDRWIRRMAKEKGMIEPFVDSQKRDGIISYGLSSSGYDRPA